MHCIKPDKSIINICNSEHSCNCNIILKSKENLINVGNSGEKELKILRLSAKKSFQQCTFETRQPLKKRLPKNREKKRPN